MSAADPAILVPFSAPPGGAWLRLTAYVPSWAYCYVVSRRHSAIGAVRHQRFIPWDVS